MSESEIVDYFMELDDDTYEYGELWYKVQSVDGVYIEPFMREEANGKTIHFYREKKFIVIYMNDVITEIIFIATCWSDDVQAFELDPEGFAYRFYERYHGRPIGYKNCNDDFNKFIDDNNLRR
jgi:hypothetical protein